jgi:nitrogen fixation protein NifU and related proteins
VNAAAALTDDLRSLYQEIILDHGRRPRNFRAVDGPTCKAEGNNPMCGDRITVTAKFGEDGTLADVAFEGKGCAISVASASMMTEALMGKSAENVKQLSAAVKDLCTGNVDAEGARAIVPESMRGDIDKLASLSGVSQFPVRVKCATLAWHALNSCMAGETRVSTEK